MATEVLQSQKSYNGRIKRVTIVPSQPGTFLVSANVVGSVVSKNNKDNNNNNNNNNEMERLEETTIKQLWDRRIDGGFPPIDLIEFEQRVEACLEPLDSSAAAATATATAAAVAGDSCSSTTSTSSTSGNDERCDPDPAHDDDLLQTTVVIKYCRDSGYLLRAAYYGQELLTTFCDGELHAISLQPIDDTDSSSLEGGFSVDVVLSSSRGNNKTTTPPPLVVLWDKHDNSGRFPEAKELKRLFRNVVAPQKNLGHSEVAETTTTTSSIRNNNDESTNTDDEEEENPMELLLDDTGDCIPCNASTNNSIDKQKNETDNDEDDDEDDETFLDDDQAEEARRYFGVL